MDFEVSYRQWLKGQPFLFGAVPALGPEIGFGKEGET